jgi:single-stranded DNA-binding protein
LQNQGVNKVILVGQVSDRPEWRIIAGSKCLCFQLITVEVFNRQGAAQEHFERHTIRVPEGVFQSEDPDVAEGTPLYIEGKITTTGKIDSEGIKRYDTAIIASKYSVTSKTPAGMPLAF